jgi:hypothetical protein
LAFRDHLAVPRNFKAVYFYGKAITLKLGTFSMSNATLFKRKIRKTAENGPGVSAEGCHITVIYPDYLGPVLRTKIRSPVWFPDFTGYRHFCFKDRWIEMRWMINKRPFGVNGKGTTE